MNHCKLFKKTVSIILVISFILNMCITSFAGNSIFELAGIDKGDSLNFIDEVEVDQTLISDDMFYLPYKNYEVNENDNSKVYFKVRRNQKSEKEEKVKLTFLDISSKYGRDYKIKVYGSGIFKERVVNANVSKNIPELIKDEDFEEYNTSDALIDGDVSEEFENMSDEEKLQELKKELEKVNDELQEEESEIESSRESENGETSASEDCIVIEEDEVISEEDKEAIEKNVDVENVDEVEENVGESDENVGESDENVGESDENVGASFASAEDGDGLGLVELAHTDEEEIDGFTNTDSTESVEETKIVETIELITEDDEENDDIEDLNVENEVIEDSDEEIENIEIVENVENTESIESDENAEKSVEEVKEEKEENKEKYEDTKDEEIEEEIGSTNVVDKEYYYEISTVSDATETINFENVKLATMSLADAFEKYSGRKNDRKHIDPSDYTNDDLKNTTKSPLYMEDSVKLIEEELKSAYIMLDFKKDQIEKIIEIDFINDNRWTGDRQLGINIESVDESVVSSYYSAFNIKIVDDEDEEPTYITFDKESYTPQNGYFTVTINRSGDLSSIATCMLDTFDITAKHTRDYSRVHAEVFFGMGINKRVVKIPMFKNFIEGNKATFKLKLQLPKGALIGDKNEAICTISKTDENFEKAEIAYNKAKKLNLLGSDNKNKVFSPIGIKPNLLKSNDVSYSKPGAAFDLSSEKIRYQSPKTSGNSNTRNEYKNGQYEMYLEDHDFFGSHVESYSYFALDEKWKAHDDYNGVQVNWKKDSSNGYARINLYNTGTKKWDGVIKYDEIEFDKTSDNAYWDEVESQSVRFDLTRDYGLYGTSPTLYIKSIKPLLRPYEISLIAADVPELINPNGTLGPSTKYYQYANTKLIGADVAGTQVVYSGDQITVQLDNYVNNPFYLYALEARDGDRSFTIMTNTKDENCNSLSFKIDNAFVRRIRSFIKYQSAGSNKGLYGKLILKPVLKKRSAKIYITNDDRISGIKTWGDKDVSFNSKTNRYEINCSYGDTIKIKPIIKSSFASIYSFNGLMRYGLKPKETSRIINVADENDNILIDVDNQEIKYVPELSQKGNVIFLRVPKEKIDKFDLTYGVFKDNPTYVDEGEYRKFIIEENSDKINGKQYEFKAICKDDTFVPIWNTTLDENTKYAQNAFYYTGREKKEENIITLTIDKADTLSYTLKGTTYYYDLPINGKTVAGHWLIAKDTVLKLDDLHFGLSDTDGKFQIVPFKSKKGYFINYQVYNNGIGTIYNKKIEDFIKTKVQVTNNYEDGQHTVEEECNVIDLGEIEIPNANNMHPHASMVRTYDSVGSSSNNIWINDEMTLLEAKVENKDLEGNAYKYTYVDKDGISHEKVEKVDKVEFVVMDMINNVEKKVLEATDNGNDVWTANHIFARGNYEDYNSGDKLYVRVTTDRMMGDGTGVDENNERKVVPEFMHTTYIPINTNINITEKNLEPPQELNLDFKMPGSFTVPLLGNLNSAFSFKGCHISVIYENNRVRLYVGFSKGIGNHFDEDGKFKGDFNIDDPLSIDPKVWNNLIDKSNGGKKIGDNFLLMPSFTFDGFGGLYFEFLTYMDPDDSGQMLKYEFTGGGAFIGANLTGQINFYVIIGTLPIFIGGSANIMAQIEIGVNTGEKIYLSSRELARVPDDFFDTKLNFDFLVRGQVGASVYAGVGLCNILSVRGGATFIVDLIWAPTAAIKYPDVSTTGAKTQVKAYIWVDAILCTIPFNIASWDPSLYGYYDDIKKYDDEHKYKSSYNLGASKGNIKSFSKPRPDYQSEFVANDDKIIKNRLRGTFEEKSTRTLVENCYDLSQPRIIKYGDNGKYLLVYLDDNSDSSDFDRTTLMYMIYDENTDTWTEPSKVVPGDKTADFSPYLINTDNKTLLLWSSRENELSEDFESSEILKKMEIYSATFDWDTETFSSQEKITDDNNYDYNPKAVKLNVNDGGVVKERVYVLYLKSEVQNNIDEAEDLLNAIQTEVNGSQLMYMVYQDGEWLYNRYFDDEWENPEITEEEKLAFIEQFKGQRFWTTPIMNGEEEINNPNIADFDVGVTDIYDITYPEFIDWLSRNGWNSESIKNEVTRSAIYSAMETDFADRRKDFIVVMFQVDFDGNPNTKEDTEIYASIYNDTDLSDLGTIRLSENEVADTLPKIASDSIDLCGFWLQNGTMIKMQSLSDIVIKETGFEKTESGSINIISADKMVDCSKISDFYPFIDKDNNKYIIWQQNTDTFDEEKANEPIKDTKDLFISGFVRTPANNDEPESFNWSNSVRLTRNGKLNNLPTTTQLENGDLLFVTNQYDLVEDGELYSVTNSNLQEILYKQVSSMKIKSIEAVKTLEQDIENVTKYNVAITLENDGLYPAKGYDYTGRILHNGTLWKPFEGSSDKYVEPGGIDIVNTEVYMDIDKTYRLDLTTAEINVKEKELSDAGCRSSMNVFKTKESFEILTVNSAEGFEKTDGTSISKETVMQEQNILRAIQDGDNCIIEGVVINNGDIDSKGDEKICLYLSDDLDNPIAKSEYLNLKIDESDTFRFVIPYDKIDLKYGYKDILILVKNDAGDTLSQLEGVTITPKVPYGFKVNGGVETITLKKGEIVNLNTTFEPKYIFRSGNVLYSTADKNIATVIDGKLIGSVSGETELSLTTKEFGGSKTIKVIVNPKEENNNNNNSGYHYGGGGSSSGGGGGGGGITLPSQPLQENMNNYPKLQDGKSYSINELLFSGMKPGILSDNSNEILYNDMVLYNPFIDMFVVFYTIPVKNGWVSMGNEGGSHRWFYCDENGALYKNRFADFNNGIYYFDENGNMVTGWKNIFGLNLYFNEENGADEGKFVRMELK